MRQTFAHGKGHLVQIQRPFEHDGHDVGAAAEVVAKGAGAGAAGSGTDPRGEPAARRGQPARRDPAAPGEPRGSPAPAAEGAGRLVARREEGARGADQRGQAAVRRRNVAAAR